MDRAEEIKDSMEKMLSRKCSDATEGFYHFHPDKIQVVDIIALGRSSSFFIQGFFDGHPECITIPNISIYSYLVSNARKGQGLRQTINDLYKKSTSLYNSPNKKIEGIVPFSLFDIGIREYINEFGPSTKNFFVAAHYALAKIIYPDRLASIRYIIYQTHQVGGFRMRTNNFVTQIHRDFPRRKIIFPIRDPRATWLSTRKLMPTSRTPFLSCVIVNYLYAIFYEVISPGRTFFIKHEDFHKNFAKTLQKLIAFVGISYHRSLEYSSFFNIEYDGTGINDGSGVSVTTSTGLFKSRPDERYARDNWKEELDGGEIEFIQWISESYMKKFHYGLYKKEKGLYRVRNIFPSQKECFQKGKGRNFLDKTCSYIIQVPLIGSPTVFLLFSFVYSIGYLMGIVYIGRLRRELLPIERG